MPVKVRTLTFEEATEIAIKNSFSIQDLELDLRRKHYGHIASLARLKSRVDLAMTTPELKQEREEKFNEETIKYIEKLEKELEGK